MSREIDSIVEQYHRLVPAVAARSFPALSHDQDLQQCGLIGLWRAAQTWDGVRPFPPYARRCILNAMRNYVRDKSRLTTHEVHASQPPPSPADQEELAAARLDLRDRIRAVWPPGSRERYILTALAAGVPKPAVASALGIDTYAVTRIARRAVIKLHLPPTDKGREP